jgi:hypothetical protein
MLLRAALRYQCVVLSMCSGLPDENKVAVMESLAANGMLRFPTTAGWIIDLRASSRFTVRLNIIDALEELLDTASNKNGGDGDKAARLLKRFKNHLSEVAALHFLCTLPEL